MLCFVFLPGKMQHNPDQQHNLDEFLNVKKRVAICCVSGLVPYASAIHCVALWCGFALVLQSVANRLQASATALGSISTVLVIEG